MIHQEQDSKILFEQFLQEKTFLSNLAPKTLSFIGKFQGVCSPLSANSTSTKLNCCSLREQGKTANCVNSYIRGINPFLSWLFENGHLQDRLRVKKLKCEEKQMRTFSDAQICAILNCKPKTKTEHRLLALLALLVDTGGSVIGSSSDKWSTGEEH